MQKEVETALRAVLHKDNRQEPLKIKTSNFLIDCDIKPWPAVRKIVFEENDREVPAFPEMIVLTVQPKPGRRSSLAYQPITHIRIAKGHSDTRDSETPGIADDWRKSGTNARKIHNSNDAPSGLNTLKNLRSSTPKGNLMTQTVSLAAALDSAAEPGDSGENNKQGSTSFHDDVLDISEESETSSVSSDDNAKGCSPGSVTNKKSKTRKKNIRIDKSNDVRQRQSKAKDVHHESTKECESYEDNTLDVEPDPMKNKKTLRSMRRKNVENSVLENTKSDIGGGRAKMKTNSLSTSVVSEQSNTTRAETVCNEEYPHSPKSDEFLRSTSEIGKQKAVRRNVRSIGNTETCDDFSQTESENSQPHKQRALRSNSAPSSNSHLSSKRHTRLKRKGVGKTAKKANSNPSGTPKSQTSDRSKSPRRSKRLKVVAQKDLPPAKRVRAKEKADGDANVNDNSNHCNLTTTGTQTQGSTYRIKNADLKFLKKFAIPENAVGSHSGRRRRRVLRTYPSTNEEMGTRSTNREALCYKRDRTLIQQEELAEEMKLQQMALSSQHQCDKPVAGIGQNKRQSFMSRLGYMMTPVKKLFN